MSRIYLTVPFEEKDRAKYAGARWDNGRRAWYVEGTADMAPFRKWLPTLDTRITLRAPAYFVAHGVERCWQCTKLTLVTAFVLPDGFEVQAEDAGTARWVRHEEPCLVDHITHLADDVGRKARSVGARLRLLLDNGTGAADWKNCCEHCNASQNDDRLFDTPGGAFHPATPQQAALVRLRTMPGTFGAAARHTAVPFFDSMALVEA